MEQKEYQFKEKTKDGLDFKILEIITETNPPYPMVVAIKFTNGWRIVYMTRDGKASYTIDFSYDLQVI